MRRAPLGRKAGLKPGLKPGAKGLSRQGSLKSKPSPGRPRRKGLTARHTPRVRPEDKELALAFRSTVCGLQARCIRCGARATDAHHFLPQRHIKGACKRLGLELGSRLWSPGNGGALCEQCHARHENAYDRLPRALVPPGAWALADELNLRPLLERSYPIGPTGPEGKLNGNGDL